MVSSHQLHANRCAFVLVHRSHLCLAFRERPTRQGTHSIVVDSLTRYGANHPKME